jgi:ketosteroid isomerase-like protein
MFRSILAFSMYMRLLILIAIIAFSAPFASAQTDLEKLIATERAFAQTAAEKGTKAAFLEFMAKDAVVFVPERTPAMPYWNGRPESNSLLSWAPNYADVSSNGALGYTTGNWEFRAKGKDDQPSAFGNFVTIWLRQPSGEYRFVVDLGVGHAAPAKYSTDVAPPSVIATLNKDRISAADSANKYFELVRTQGIKKAYSQYAADDVRVFREDRLPEFGKRALLTEAGKKMSNIVMAKRMVFFEADDLAYVTNTYSIPAADGSTESGNFMQVWKFRDGRWQIVLDIFKPVPAKQN